MKNAYFAIMAIPVIIGVLVVAYMVQEPQESDGITTTGLLSEASPILGSADARITIIEWGDYQCEFCRIVNFINVKRKICKFWICKHCIWIKFSEFAALASHSHIYNIFIKHILLLRSENGVFK